MTGMWIALLVAEAAILLTLMTRVVQRCNILHDELRDERRSRRMYAADLEDCEGRALAAEHSVEFLGAKLIETEARLRRVAEKGSELWTQTEEIADPQNAVRITYRHVLAQIHDALTP